MENGNTHGFYEERGYVRHMVIIRPSYKDQIKSLSKRHRITQGEIIEALIDIADTEKLDQNLRLRKECKFTKGDLLKKIKGLSQEKISEIMKLLD